jgi:putative transferase (TIGR04331 family)
MFLIKTSDQRFWKTDDKIIFLGGWCKTYANRNAWENLDYKVVPYHWDDRAQLFQDYQYLNKVYEKYLQIISKKINILHGTDHSYRYWRIVLGPWLHYFIAVVFDRYQTLKTACQSYQITDTILPDLDGDSWIPEGMVQFCSYSESDAYNEYIYSEIIRNLALCPHSIIPSTIFGSNDKAILDNKKMLFSIHNIKEKIKIWLHKTNRYRNPLYVLVNPYFSLFDQIKFQLKLGQIPTLYFRLPLKYIKIKNKKLRFKLDFVDGNSQFEKLLDYLIPKQIPKAYIEYYDTIQKENLKYFSTKAKVINTSTSYNSDDYFKIWAADMTDKGSKLVISQHGGHFFTGLWSWFEEHQFAISDCFVTWGKSLKNEKKLYFLPAGKLMSAKHRLKPRNNGKILLVLCSAPRFSSWMYSIPVASQLNNYFNDQVAFCHYLTGDILKLLRVRFYMHDYGWGEKEKILKFGSGIKKAKSGQSMIKQLNNSRLFIGTYNATTYLETFAGNFPTILFWNPKYWEIRPEAQKYFDALRAVGILHDTPESASNKVNEIYMDPSSWWESEEVQGAKNMFCKYFAMTDSNYLNKWKKFFKKIYC